MTDQYALCLAEYKLQLQTLSATYFPATTGRAAGWQVSEDDTTPLEGGDYFIVLKPGTFSNVRQGLKQENEWHVTTILYVRYPEYWDAWRRFRLFRSDILSLPDTAPLKKHGMYDQSFASRDEAGYLINDQGQYTDFIVQSLDCTIRQRALIARQF